MRANVQIVAQRVGIAGQLGPGSFEIRGQFYFEVDSAIAGLS